MIISFAIFFIILFIALKDKNKTLIFLSISMPIFNSVNLFKGFSIGACASVLMFVFFWKEVYENFRKKEFRLLTLTFLLYVLPILFSLYIVNWKHFPSAICEIASFVIYPLCLISLFEQKIYRDFFNKYAFLLFSIVIIYCLFEEMTTNYYVKYMESLGVFRGEDIGGAVRFGMHRAQCFFSYHETLSCFCWLGSFMLLWQYTNNFINISKKYFVFLFFGLIICLFCTGSRSGYISFIIVLCAWISSKRSNILYLPFFVFVLFYFFSDQISLIISSIIDSDSNSSDFGSSQSMREGQLEVTLYYWSKASNPFFGNGYFFTDDFIIGNESALMGAESMWFRTLMDKGLFGAISMILISILTLCFAVKINWRLAFLPMAFLCAKTVAVVPETDFSYYYIYLILFYYEKQFYK